ncbi:MAG TPA: alpha-1,4-glucan--maltose-1-phosphate maltosyltransferase, partial [Flavobacteriaceae bacterium]|nr:alpha-1,4-glucan--maltose-1-phosphate maltosyltransferase [Flavobacteriaceae bacterium]
MRNQSRVIIENLHPQIEAGLHPIKCVVNEIIPITANVLGDGHDIIAANLCFKHEKAKSWTFNRMYPLQNDKWEASFSTEKQGFYEYKIEGWVDYALNWQHGIKRKIDDSQKVTSELLEGVDYLDKTIKVGNASEKKYLQNLKKLFTETSHYNEAIKEATSQELHDIFEKYPEKHLANESTILKVYCDREKALFSTWYEFFPRSSSPIEGQHGTFKDC